MNGGRIMVAMAIVAAVLALAWLVPRARAWRRRTVEQQTWQWRAQETCALAAAIHDQLDARLSGGGADENEGAPEDVEEAVVGEARARALTRAERRWIETEHLMDQFSAKLYSLFAEAPNLLASRALSDLQVTLMSLRSIFQIQQGLWMDPARAATPVQAARVRLADFDTAAHALEATI